MFFSWINRNYEISAIKVHSWRSLKVKYLAGKLLLLFLSYFELINSRVNRCFKYQSTNLTITKYILVGSLKIIKMTSWKPNLYFLLPRTSMSQNRQRSDHGTWSCLNIRNNTLIVIFKNFTNNWIYCVMDIFQISYHLCSFVMHSVSEFIFDVSFRCCSDTVMMLYYC